MRTKQLSKIPNWCNVILTLISCLIPINMTYRSGNSVLASCSMEEILFWKRSSVLSFEKWISLILVIGVMLELSILFLYLLITRDSTFHSSIRGRYCEYFSSSYLSPQIEKFTTDAEGITIQLQDDRLRDTCRRNRCAP